MANDYSQAPSSVDATGSVTQARFDNFSVNIDGNLSTGARLAGVVTSRLRVLGVRAFRGTAGAGDGAGGSTDVDVNVRPLGGSNASILPANAIEFEQADGDALSKVATPSASAVGWDGVGVLVEAGGVISVDVDAIEAGATAPTGLSVTILCQYC
jgi:hypothetical protein